MPQSHNSLTNTRRPELGREQIEGVVILYSFFVLSLSLCQEAKWPFSFCPIFACDSGPTSQVEYSQQRCDQQATRRCSDDDLNMFDCGRVSGQAGWLLDEAEFFFGGSWPIRELSRSYSSCSLFSLVFAPFPIPFQWQLNSLVFDDWNECRCRIKFGSSTRFLVECLSTNACFSQFLALSAFSNFSVWLREMRRWPIYHLWRTSHDWGALARASLYHASHDPCL